MGRRVLLLALYTALCLVSAGAIKHPSSRFRAKGATTLSGAAILPDFGGGAVHPDPGYVAAASTEQPAGPVATSISLQPAVVEVDAPGGGAMPTGVVAAAAAGSQTCGYTYQQIDLRPMRMQWNSSHGYCCEMSVQMTALTRGVWVSQRQARLLSGNSASRDLLLMTRTDATGNAFNLLKNKLAFDIPGNYFWDDLNQTVNTATGSGGDTGTPTPPASAFVAWIKRHIAAGRPVITALRLFTPFSDSYYDHIVPLFAVCSNDTNITAPLVNATDAFSMTTLLRDETNRSVLDSGFYAKWKACPYSYERGEVGCIPSDIYNYGLAMGGLKDPSMLYIPTSRLYITGWSDNKTNAQDEPGESSATVGNAVNATYSLLVYNLTAGQQYRTYRMEGTFSVFALPYTKAALGSACTSKGAGCKFVTYNATTSSVQITQASNLGPFKANSVQYFLTVTWP